MNLDPPSSDFATSTIDRMRAGIEQFLSDDLDELVENSPAVLDALLAADTPIEPDVQSRYLAVLVLAAGQVERFDRALDAAQMFRVLAETTSSPTIDLKATLSLGMLFDLMGDGWQALSILEDCFEHKQLSETKEAESQLCNAFVAVSNRLVAEHSLSLSNEERQRVLTRAEGRARQAVASLARYPNVHAEVSSRVNLADTFVLQSQFEVADQQLTLAEQLSTQIHSRSARSWAETIRAGWLVAQGRYIEAIEHVAPWLAPASDGSVQATRSRQIAYEAAIGAGHTLAALEHLEIWHLASRRRRSHQMRAQSDLLLTRAEAAALAADQRREIEVDHLTQVGNRRRLTRALAEFVDDDSERPLAVMMIDLDHFKSVNDRFGHSVGDQVLVELVEIVADRLRTTDVLTRYGGEEFVVLLPGTTAALAAEVGERIREALAAHVWATIPAPYVLTVSVGVACVPPLTIDSVLDAADQALYQAKHAGRNQMAMHTGGA